jgi:GT2 family glycosyltransferase
MKVVAVVATHRRLFELRRLVASLENSACALLGVVVVDNAAEPACRALVEASALPHRYVAALENLGCGGGLALAEQMALREFPELTHVWVLDDDAAIEPGTLALLLAAMERADAVAACPQAADATGRLDWFPGLLDRVKFDVLRRAATPGEYLARCGPAPAAFSWATGVALLVRRDALERAGVHRGDFWVRGEDLDFALRITATGPGLYVPEARVAHIPPLVTGPDPGEYAKRCAMLQNTAFLSLRTRHGRRIARHLPGNSYRFLRVHCRILSALSGSASSSESPRASRAPTSSAAVSPPASHGNLRLLPPVAAPLSRGAHARFS